MINLKDNVIVITGAASGMGRQMAIQLADLGAHLALSDINGEALQKTVALISNKSVKIKTDVINVADEKAVFNYANDVMDYFGHVDRIINNAGKTGGDTINDVSVESFKFVMDINFYGVFYFTKAFLPHLIKRPSASIVNMGSLNSFVPFPTNGAYNCSKYAVLGLSETLHQELKNTNIKVTSVHPGGIQTNLILNSNNVGPGKTIEDVKASQEKFNKIALTSPEKAARLIIKAMRKKRSKVIVGPDAKFMIFLKRIFPKFTVSTVGKYAMKSHFEK